MHGKERVRPMSIRNYLWYFPQGTVLIGLLHTISADQIIIVAQQLMFKDMVSDIVIRARELVCLTVYLVDGYPMQDVIMRWKGSTPEKSVSGVEEADIPQFTIMNYKTISTVESLATGT